MLKNAVVFVCLLAVTFAALERAPLERKPDKFKDEEGCYVSELDEVIPFGKSAQCHHHCMLYRCHQDHLVTETCGIIEAGPGQKVVKDHSKPYPECCGTFEKA